MANCLQFGKETDLNPGMSGSNRTRAMVCELLAMKLLKEYTARELIDALSYGFYPFQGQGQPPATAFESVSETGKAYSRAVRISCLEIAIRAQAKHLLAHPLVVQQLEAIWAGNIVFHSVADSLHRLPVTNTVNLANYGAISKQSLAEPATTKRSVTIYNPRNASLFKLSRLRVPRYRQALSTISFAILLFLFLAVTYSQSLSITGLEIVFWLWSAGFMLDEVVGFNEQGFSLYLMSFWNIFDLGILLLLCCYMCMRVYGMAVPAESKHAVAVQAYDVLASCAVFLLPRLFSVLDHVQYFSQLLIAFRMMAADLIAVFILIAISCSGFFVAFTFSFQASADPPGNVLYYLFQMLMGYTPTAWHLWDRFNIMGRIVLVLFLFISHFLVLTILASVLSKSFAEVTRNAKEEHQFLFAVNTISMVKSDALFSYVAPTNILAWLIAPLRYMMSFRRFIRLNRIVIKVTHFPILLSIYLYESTILSSKAFSSAELIEGLDKSEHARRRARRQGAQQSVIASRKDHALEEVFQRPSKDNTLGRQTRNAVDDWMQSINPGGNIHPPEENRSIAAEVQGTIRRRLRKKTFGTLRDFSETTLSVVSDPEDFHGSRATRQPRLSALSSLPPLVSHLSRQTGIDGDDEHTSSDSGQDNVSRNSRTSAKALDLEEKQPFSHNRKDHIDPTQCPTLNLGGSPAATQFSKLLPANRTLQFTPAPKKSHQSNPHNPNATADMNSPAESGSESDSDNESDTDYNNRALTTPPGRTEASATTPRRLARRVGKQKRPSRRVRDPRVADMHTTNIPGLVPASEIWDDHSRSDRTTHSHSHNHSPAPSLAAIDFTSDTGLGIDIDIGNPVGGAGKTVSSDDVGAAPASFATRMAYATERYRGNRAADADADTHGMLSRLVLARMNTLEEGFRDVIKEVRDLKVLGREEQTMDSRTGTVAGKKAGRIPDSGCRLRSRASRASHSSGELRPSDAGGTVHERDHERAMRKNSKRDREKTRVARGKRSVDDNVPSGTREGIGTALLRHNDDHV